MSRPAFHQRRAELRSGRVRVALTPLQALAAPCRQTNYAPPARVHDRRRGGLTLSGPAGAAGSSSIAALQVALQAHGLYPAAVDGVQGPLTTTGLTNLQRVKGHPGHRAPRAQDALGARAARAAAARAARARRRRRRLGRLLARVPADPVRPRPEGGRRPVHGCDRRGAGAVPGEEAARRRRHRREAHLSGARRPRRSRRARSRRRRWRRTSSPRARASTRSRSATASARCCSRSRTGSSCPP